MTLIERKARPTEPVLAESDLSTLEMCPGSSLPQRFAFAIGRARAAVVVTLRGDLAGPAVVQLEDILDDLICDQGNLTVVIDLRDLSGADPAALALFSAAAGWARQRGGSLRLHEPSRSVSLALTAAQDTGGLDLVVDCP